MAWEVTERHRCRSDRPATGAATGADPIYVSIRVCAYTGVGVIGREYSVRLLQRG